MKALNKIKAIILDACAIFTAITFIMCGLGTWLSDGKLATTLQALLGFFAFSLILSCLNEVLKIKAMHISLRVLLHFIGSAVCFYGIFIKLGGFSEKESGTLVIMALFAIIYVIIALALLIIGYTRLRAKRDKEKYDAQFDFEE